MLIRIIHNGYVKLMTVMLKFMIMSLVVRENVVIMITLYWKIAAI